MSKILICGFPHCGTSILKSIICHIDDTEEICHETPVITKSTDKKYIVAKYPFVLSSFFNETYKDYIKIFIIRNPLYVFSSLRKRFNDNIPSDHSINAYIKTIKLFIHYSKNPSENIYTLRYEDLFENDYKQITNVLDNIGLQYTNDIFDNSKYVNKIIECISVPVHKPLNSQHGEYRTWEINQPFISNNDISKIDLTGSQKQLLLNDKYIQEVYPDIKLIYEQSETFTQINKHLLK